MSAALTAIPDSPALGLHVVPNCRLADTRGIGGFTGAYGMPELLGGDENLRNPTRDFPVAGQCGIPATAKAIAAHIATAETTAIGFLMIGPADGPNAALPPPLVATLNYAANSIAADATTLVLGNNGIRVFSNNPAQFIIDITGYFEELPQPPIRVTPVGMIGSITPGVQQTSSLDWVAWNNLCGTQGTDDVPISFTNGEQHTPPLGTGSFDADLSTAATATTGAALATETFNGLKVSDITGLRFATRQDTSDTPFLYMRIDSTGGNTYNQNIYFIPANNQAAQGGIATGGVWQTWNAGTGNWNDDSAAAPVIHYEDDFTGGSPGDNDGGWFPNGAGGSVVLNGDGTGTETGTAFTAWGGYSDSFPTYGYTTSLDVFVDVTQTGQWDFSSAINLNAAASVGQCTPSSHGPGCFLRDFAFSVGQDTTPVVHYEDDFTGGALGDNDNDWFPNGAGGAVTLNGDDTATETGTAFTDWNGYSDTWPAHGYTTSLDVYIDVTQSGQWDFSSAINLNAAASALNGCTPSSHGPGCFLRDFAFSVGQDTISGDPTQWFVSTSNNSPGDPANGSTAPAHAVIAATGWYTFAENFHDNGSGVLAVTLTVAPAGGAVIQSWTLSNPGDLISNVGGNRYGWFVGNTVGPLKIDNQILSFNPPSQWLVSTSNNSPGDPANGSTAPAHAVLTTSGWYTFQENFQNNAGVLAVTLTVKPAAAPRGVGGADIQSWTLSDPSDSISMVGGNRYGWFVGNTVGPLLIDNEVLTFNGATDTGPGGTHPLANYSNATILGIRAALGCSIGAPSGHEAVDAFEISIDGEPATIYDFEHQ